MPVPVWKQCVTASKRMGRLVEIGMGAAIAPLSLGLGLLLISPGAAETVEPSDPAPAAEWHNCMTREMWSPAKTVWCARLNTLKNSEYSVPQFGSVLLENGSYDHEEDRFTASLLNYPGLIAYGDLTGDDQIDGVAFLHINSGGSGQFVYLLPVLGIDSETPQPLTPIFLGDRIQLNEVAIAAGEVTVDFVTQDEDDAFCCPTLPLTLRYQVQPSLVLVGGDDRPYPYWP